MKTKDLMDGFFSSVKEGYPMAVQYYLSKGANVNAFNYKGKTALMLSAEAKSIYYDVFCLLLKSGADTSLQNFDGETVLDILNNRLMAEKDKVRRGYIMTMIDHIKTGDLLYIPVSKWNHSSQTQKNIKLLYAVKEGDLNKVIKKVKKGANLYFSLVDYSEFNKKNALEIASYLGNKEIVTVLLKQMVLNNMLFAAIENNDLKAAQEAIEQGAIPQAFDSFGYPAVVRAAQKGSFDILKLLHKNGADLNMWQAEMTTALIEATKLKRADMVEFILANGGNKRHRDFKDNSALFYAIESGNVLSTKLLMEGQYIDQRNKAFLTAVKKGYEKIVCLLLADDGIDMTSFADKKELLLLAVESKNVKVFESLLPYVQKEFDKQNLNGEYPVMTAARLGCTQMLSIMEREGVDLHVKSEDGWTALHAACATGQLLSAQFLIHRGANINGMSREGTPLELAARRGAEELVITLLNNGVEQDRAALEKAVQNRQYKIVDILTEEGFRVDGSALTCSVFNLDMQMLNNLLKTNPDVNASDKDGYTALTVAIMTNQPSMVYTLLKVGANPLQESRCDCFKNKTGNAFDAVNRYLSGNCPNNQQTANMHQILSMLQKVVCGHKLTENDKPMPQKITTDKVANNQNVLYLTRM